MRVDVDGVFGRIGGLGATQKKIFLLISLPHIWCTFQVLAISFIGTDPGWNCTKPLARARDSGGVDVRLLTDHEAKCAYYERGECVPQYSKDYTSIVTEWDLICSRAYYPNLSQSGYFLGLMIGGWLFGTLSDIHGRKKIYFLAFAGNVLCHVGTGLAPLYSIFFLIRVVQGVFGSGVIIVGYTLMLEVISSSKRSVLGIAIHQFASIGFMSMAVTAYYIRDWRMFMVVPGFSGAVFLATWRLTPESPRWLLTQGREKQAVATLAWIARGNGRQMPDCQLQRSAGERSVAGRSVSLLDLLRGRTVRHRTIILAIAWCTNSAVYYALSLNADSLGGGRYMPFLLFGLVEIPAHCTTYLLINRIGRRRVHASLLMLAGIFCLTWSLADWSGASAGIKTSLALLGKMAMAGSFGVVYLYSAELFPTEVRTLGMGISSVASRTGGIMAPLVFLMPSSHAMIVLSGLGVVAGLLTLSLPETLNQPLPETLAQLNSLTV